MAEILPLILSHMEPYVDIIESIIAIIISIVISTIILKLIKRHLLKKVKTKKDTSNVTVFLDLLKYLFILFVVIIAFSSYYGSWGELSFVIGLLTVALGWALQKPVSGVVAWLIIITKRPFHIGDRVIISDVKGDITSITLTHIFLDELGGTIDGEEKSNRTIMIPTSAIFDKEIVNYNHENDYILDEIVSTITYESNLKDAEKIVIDSACEIMTPFWKKFPKRIPKEPHIRLSFKDSGIDLTVRYHTIATKRNRIATDIIREIHRRVRKSENVEFAYPHTEVLLRNKP